MGAVIALLLVLSTLTACSGGTVTDVKNALPALAAVPEETTVTYTVEVTEYADIIRDDDGTELVEYSYQIPVLLAVRSDGSQVLDAASPAEKAALEAVEVFLRYSHIARHRDSFLMGEQYTAFFGAVCSMRFQLLRFVF